MARRQQKQTNCEFLTCPTFSLLLFFRLVQRRRATLSKVLVM